MVVLDQVLLRQLRASCGLSCTTAQQPRRNEEGRPLGGL
jgi:hypothetical protein